MSTRRILFVGLDDKSIVNGIVKRYKPEEIFNIGRPSRKGEPNECEIIWNDFKYKESPFKRDQLAPIDEKILRLYANTERIFLRMADRLFIGSSYQKRKRFYHEQMMSCLHLIESFSPTLVIFGNLPHEGFSFLIYEIAKKNQIKTVFQYSLPVRPGKCYFKYTAGDIEDHRSQIRSELEKLESMNLSEDELLALIPYPVKYYLEEYKYKKEEVIRSFTRYEEYKKTISFFYLRKFIKLVKKIYSSVIRGTFFTALKRELIERPDNFSKIVDPYFTPYKKLMVFYRRNQIAPNFEDPYIYFPLHFQPEASTSPLGRGFVDQELIIGLLSKAYLNTDVTIYVKEHPRPPKMEGSTRTRDFYEKILSYPNVRLIDINANSIKLIENSLAVASVSGSAVLESIIIGKHVFAFGERIFNEAKNVHLIESYDDLLEATKKVKSSPCSEKDLLTFFLALSNCCFESLTSDTDLLTSPKPNISFDQSHKNQLKSYIKFIDNFS